jgi:hypothetical protein
LTAPPWRLTLRQFVERVRQDYGVTIHNFGFPMIGPRGPVHFSYLEREDLTEAFALMLGIEEDDVLTPTLLRSLCRQLNLPPEDFHLDPEEGD